MGIHSEAEMLELDYLANHADAIPVLAHAHRAAWTDITPEISLEQRSRRLVERARIGGIPTAIVAIVDGRVAGVAALVECDLNSHAHLSPWLASVLVLPEYRRQGVGSHLSMRIASEAAGLGFDRLYLFTFDKQAFYERLGWALLERGTFAGRPVTIMTRDVRAEVLALVEPSSNETRGWKP